MHEESRPRQAMESGQCQVTEAIDAAIVLVESNVRASSGKGGIYWQWHDIGATLRAAKAQLRNIPCEENQA